MKKKLFFICVFIMFFLFCPFFSIAKADDDRQRIGKFEYKLKEPSVTVNINPEIFGLVDFCTPLTTRYTNPMCAFKYRKSVYDGYLYNDLDSLIIVIEYLEEIAKKELPDEDSNDLALSYIRSIEKEYTKFPWNQIAGSVNEKFINKVKEADEKRIDSISITYYLSCFLNHPINDIYGSEEKDTDSNGNNQNDIQLFMIDPLNPSNDGIDLVHMFAVMDAAYTNTGKDRPWWDSEYVDLCGWAGDLFTFAGDIKCAEEALKLKEKLEKENIKPSDEQNELFELYENYNLNNDFGFKIENENWHKAVDLGKYVGLKSSSFSLEDMLADIDGLNICRLILNYNNKLSKSIAAYYDLIDSDNTCYDSRYSCFLRTSVYSTYDNSFVKKGFAALVKYMCGLEVINILNIKLARVRLSQRASEEIFGKVSKLFISYIEAMAQTFPEEDLYR